MANVLVMLGKVDDGVAQYREALRLDPRYAQAHYNLAVTLIQAGRREEAIAHLEEALRLDPDDANVSSELDFARAQPR